MDVLPDGQVVFADNYDRAFDWIALDSISFKIEGVGKLQDIQLDEHKFEYDNDLRPLAVVHSGPNMARLHNGQIAMKKGEAIVPTGREVMFTLPTDIRPLHNTIPIAFCMPKLRSISLSHVSFQTSGESDRTPLSEMAGYFVEDDMVHLYGQVVAMPQHFTTLSCLLILPPALAPACFHDFLVCGAGDRSDAAAGGAMLRLHPNGCLMFMGTSLDSSVECMQTLSLDGIRFLVASLSEETASLTTLTTVIELTLGPNVSAYPVLNDHSEDKTLPGSVAGQTETASGVGCDGDLLASAQAGGYNGCSCEEFPCSHIHHAANSAGDISNILEDAATGGYTGCQCDKFPCVHVFSAATKGKKAKKAEKQGSFKAEGDTFDDDGEETAVEGTVNFGRACVLQKFNCSHLSGQVFKRRSRGIASRSSAVASLSEAHWAPGNEAQSTQ